jgi:hypothetical protein
METQAVASLLAQKFNELLPPTSKPIKFVDVGVYEAEDEDGNPFYLNVEERLPNYKEKFTKWCSNATYVNKNLVCVYA